jgi:hypothetical protein
LSYRRGDSSPVGFGLLWIHWRCYWLRLFTPVTAPLALIQ